MDQIPLPVWIAGGIAILVIVVICVIFILQRRRVDLTHSKSPGQKPEWIKTVPPPETVAATQADGEGIGLYDYDPGEGLAAAFVEQIEDIVHARLGEDPALAGIGVDFKTSPSGELEVWVDGKSYMDVSDIPDERLREVVRQAISSWEQGG
ncbi:MAG: hypothetical protein JW918_17315 [Anaerolineae bacterium]|nr:hypothetical protein [Anaerolineae bacterium]